MARSQVTFEVSQSRLTVLITGAGGAATPGLIERLRCKGYRVLAADMDSNAVGLYLADMGFVIPQGSSRHFLPALRAICHREEVNALVPLVDEELVAALELEQDGVAVLLPRREFVVACLDKFRLMRRLDGLGIPVPKTRLASDSLEGMGFPLIAKPRTGRGSRGIGIVNSQEQLASYMGDSPYPREKLVIQEYVDGTEFTVSVVVWRDGKVKAVVSKEIILKQGITRLAVTRHNTRIDTLCRRIQDTLRADGPFNVQLRIDRITGEPLVFEINPRFSTTISLTIAAGVDELGALLAEAIVGRQEQNFGDWQEGLVLLRRTSDQFMDEAAFLARPILKSEKGT